MNFHLILTLVPALFFVRHCSLHFVKKLQLIILLSTHLKKNAILTGYHVYQLLYVT